jgi:hypothetical protein
MGIVTEKESSTITTSNLRPINRKMDEQIVSYLSPGILYNK